MAQTPGIQTSRALLTKDFMYVQMVGDLLEAQDLRLMAVLICGALATVPSQKHIAFITTALYACKDWMLRDPKFCEWLLQVRGGLALFVMKQSR